MKAAKASLQGALDRPDPAVRFYLFYGPDEAGSRALALRLLKGLGNAEGAARSSSCWEAPSRPIRPA